MAGDNSLKVRIEAQVSNYEDIVKTIKDGLEKGLVDGISEKTLNQLSKKLETIRAQLDVESFKEAVKALQRFNVELLKVEETINTAAGGALSEVAKLTEKLQKAKDLKEDLEKRDPRNRYRELEDSRGNKTGEFVRSKSGLNRDLIGIHSEEDWKKGNATFTDADGQPLNINFGGATWSIQSAIRNIVAALNDSAILYTEEVKKAVAEFGYNIRGTKPGEYAATRPDLAVERVNEINKWNQQMASADLKIQEADLELKEAKAEAENITITAETGTFTTPLLKTAETGKEVNKISDEMTASAKKVAKAQHEQSDAAEQTRDRQDALNKIMDEGTMATNRQQGAVARAVTTFFGYQMVLRQLRRLWREAITTITELDKQLTTQAMVTGMTREETWNLVSTYQELADATGLAQTTIAGVTTEYLRQGESLENALTLTKAAAASATVAGISASDSVKYLTTAIHGFKLEAGEALEVSDKFAALAASAATNYEDLAIALSKVASQAALAGMSMDYTLALLTTGLDVTQEAPESIGTALKTVIARMREISDYGKTLEDDTDINQVESGLEAVGIKLRDNVGELRSTEDVLKELGGKWQDLSANQQAAVAKALAGTRQQSRLVAIMENYQKVQEYEQTAMTSIGATTAQQVTYLQGMEAATNKLQNTYQSLIKSIISSDEAIGLVNMLQGMLKWVADFLRQPAGRWALLSTVSSMLFKSKDLMDRIKTTVDSLISSLSNIRKEEQQILEIQKNQLNVTKQEIAQRQSKFNLTSGSVRPNGWLSDDPTKSTLGDVGNNLVTALTHTLGKILTPWKNWDVSQSWQNTGAALKSWGANNSLIGKIRGAVADRTTVKNARNDIVAQLTKAEQELTKTRKEGLEIQQRRTKAEEDYNAAFDTETGMVDETAAAAAMEEFTKASEAVKTNKAAELAAAEKIKAIEEQKKVLSSSQLSTAEKMDYLARQRLIKQKDDDLRRLKNEALKTGETQEQRAAEIEKTEQEREQLALEQKQTVAKAAGSTTGAKLSAVMGKVSGYIAAATTAVSMIQEWIDIGKNFGKELGQEALDEAKRIQSEMYENTQLKSTIASTSSTIEKLSKQVVKTTEDLEALDAAQQEFADAVGLSKEEVIALGEEGVANLAQAKQQELDAKNAELAQELNDTLTKAGYNRSAGEVIGNILGKTAIGAGAGSMVNMGWGTLIGAIGGLVVGAGEEITRAAIAADAKNKINAMLETDEGVEQFKYAMKLNYKQIANVAEKGGDDMAQALSAMFSSVVELFDKDDLKKILEKFNYNMGAFAEHFNQLLGGDLEAIEALTSSDSNLSTRVNAAQKINEATKNDEELNEAFTKINSNYLAIGQSLNNASLAIADKYEWSLTNVSNLVNTFTSTEELNNTLAELDKWLTQGGKDTKALSSIIADLSTDEIKAIEELVTGGRSLQDVADINTRNRNQIQGFRDTQAKWNTMSESEQQKFIDENAEFFKNPETMNKWFTGQDISAELREYQKKVQENSRAMYEGQREKILMEIAVAEKQGNDELVAQKQAYLALIDQRLEEVDHMFDLSLSEIVDKQNEQLSKLKEMYQAEEDALVDSLNKRKEAYQKYFDDLAEAETVEDYATSRDQLIENISKLSAGSDAASRNKVRELQKQLATLEKEEMQRQKEEARQAVLDNIDSQVEQIQQQFEDLLKNNQALLDSMDDSTRLQYLQYLATLGLTQEEYALRAKELGDTLDGQWTSKGLQSFGSASANTSNVDVNVPSPSQTIVDHQETASATFNIGGQSENVTLSMTQMKELINGMFTWLNTNAGTSFKPV